MATVAVTVDCACLARPDMAAIEWLARRRLEARRQGCDMCITAASDELVAMIELAGLGDVLRVEVQRKSEERKEPGRVEEEGELPDLSV